MALRALDAEFDILEEGLAVRHRMARRDTRVLEILHRRGGESPGQLVRDLSVSSGAVTLIIKRLEERRLVRREFHPEDRRRVVVTLAPAGEDLVRQVFGDIAAALGPVMADLKGNDLGTVERFLNECRAAILRHRAAK
jgi:DNA-binding MarR family transcriptional regulator